MPNEKDGLAGSVPRILVDHGWRADVGVSSRLSSMVCAADHGGEVLLLVGFSRATAGWIWRGWEAFCGFCNLFVALNTLFLLSLALNTGGNIQCDKHWAKLQVD
jgi:hypothetical protein